MAAGDSRDKGSRSDSGIPTPSLAWPGFKCTAAVLLESVGTDIDGREETEAGEPWRDPVAAFALVEGRGLSDCWERPAV